MSEFLALKKKLFSADNRYRIFLGNLEEIALEQARELDQPRYEPLHFEYLLDDFAGLLDRCIQYRRDAMELEIQAVRAFADYDLFQKTYPLERELEMRSLAVATHQSEAVGFDRAAKVFEAAADAPLASGMAANMRTRSAAASLTAASAEAASALIDEKYTARAAYQEAYHQRHAEPGNAHNYAERAERVLTLLAEDLNDAWAKAEAIAVGYEAIFKTATPPLPPVSSAALDRLVAWGREIIRDVALLTQDEVEYDLIVPLTQGWKGNDLAPLMTPQDLKAIIDSDANCKHIDFKLDGVFFNQARVRLRGVELSFGNRSSTFVNGVRSSDLMVNYVLRATIFTPEQRVGDNPPYRRPPVILGSVPNYVQLKNLKQGGALECFNVNPIGAWTIFLEAAAVSDNGDVTRIEDGWLRAQVIRDLKLHLRVRTLPAKGMRSAFS